MNKGVVKTLLVLLIIGSAIVVMHGQSQRNELREAACESMDALHSPTINGTEALRCEATINEAIAKKVVCPKDLYSSPDTVTILVESARQRDAMRQSAFVSMEKLQNYQNLNRTQQVECAKNVVSAVNIGIVSYEELGAEDWYQAINEMANQSI